MKSNWNDHYWNAGAYNLPKREHIIKSINYDQKNIYCEKQVWNDLSVPGISEKFQGHFRLRLLARQAANKK